MTSFGEQELQKLLHKAENMSTEEFRALLNRAQHVRGPNGEPSYAEQIASGFVGMPLLVDGVLVNAVYKHYKGNEYLVVDVVTDCETLEKVVIYEALYENPVAKAWCRKLSDFLGITDDGQPRFRLKAKTSACPHSSVVEHPLGKGEVDGSKPSAGFGVLLYIGAVIIGILTSMAGHQVSTFSGALVVFFSMSLYCVLIALIQKNKGL